MLNYKCGLTKVNDLIGEHESIVKIRQQINKISKNSANILISGESGTGKEVVAKMLHESSPRAQMPFVAINAGAIPSELLESELFGHEKGAFTGAINTKRGKFEIVNNGTLFLDEIGDLPLSLQVKLLRVLQERKFERVGGHTSIKLQARIICATHKDLLKLISKKLFREDLYYRLNVLHLYIPSLKDRIDDLPLLVNYFLQQFNLKEHKEVKIESQVIDFFKSYTWPGNIRELSNIVERLVAMNDDTINLDTLNNMGLLLQEPSKEENNKFLDLKTKLQQTEKFHISQALVKAQGDVGVAAKLLGIRKNTLIDKLNKA